MNSVVLMHLIFWPVALFLGCLCGVKKHKSWIIVSLVTGLVYECAVAVVACSSIRILIVGLLTAEWLGCYLGSFALLWAVGFILVAPKTNFILLIRSLKRKAVLISTISILLIIVWGCTWRVITGKIYDIMPYVDIYENIDNFSLGHIETTTKGFGVLPLNDTAFIDYGLVVRLYKMPSFSREELIEIRCLDNRYELFCYTPKTGTIWEDRLQTFNNEEGTVVGGQFLNESAYKPTLNIIVDTVKDGGLIKELADSIKVFGVSKMRSVKRGKKFDFMVIEGRLDGTSYYVDVLENETRITFRFWGERYDDYRYNWIMDNFDRFFSIPERRDSTDMLGS